MKYNLFKQNLISVLLVFSLIIGFIVVSCKGNDDKEIIKPPEEEIITPPVETENYFSFQSSTANQLNLKSKAANWYEITTTGEDPYILLSSLKKANPSENVVLTFDYESTEEIEYIQCFFAPPISEEHSIRTGILKATTTWQSFSLDLSENIKTFNWGAGSDFLRLDFGEKSGVVIQIRNIRLRERTSEEAALAKEYEDLAAKKLRMNSDISEYLKTEYDSHITEVDVGDSKITVKGNYSSDGTVCLCEVMPYDTVTEMKKFTNKTSLSDPSFSIELDRYVIRDGFKYDRLLSKWVIIKTGTDLDEVISHARYADKIYSSQNLPKQVLLGRKGLGGCFYNGEVQSDMDNLNITSTAINIVISESMYLNTQGNTIAHTYGGKTYYFNKTKIETYDNWLLKASSKNVVVAAILLVRSAASSADPQIGALLQHPEYNGGYFTMPNMTTPASVNCYAAALDFLADRYSRSDNKYGRIQYWIMHNEVDIGSSWTNMGEQPMLVYMDTYIKSMRMCYNIARKYDKNSEVFGSFAHSWTKPFDYATKDMLEALNSYCNAEGDFQWALACHPYPEDLNEPKTWNDADAKFSMNSPLVTFKNLEVLNAWIKLSENKYLGTIKRTLWLSENGTNSRTYSDKDLNEQAAGCAYTMKKFEVLDGIDVILWHSWFDNRGEFGLRLGLRRFLDDETDPAGKKPVWYVYQAAGTDKEDEVFDQYKSIIGIDNWDDIIYDGVIN